MNQGAPLPVGQHDLEIQANRLAWQRKPQLRSVYRGFHELIASRLDRTVPGLVVELGSGMGSIKDVIADCVTTDLFPNPWLDRQENAYRLSFADATVSNPSGRQNHQDAFYCGAYVVPVASGAQRERFSRSSHLLIFPQDSRPHATNPERGRLPAW